MFGYKLLDILTAVVVTVVFVITLNIIGGMVLGPKEHGQTQTAAKEAEAEAPAKQAEGGQQVAVAGDAASGEKVFKKCKACHDNAADGKHKTGPNLFGLVGKAAGTADGFGKYSDALKSSGITWDAATLDAFLADPKGKVPGIKMAFAGLKKAEDRASVIAYLGGGAAPAPAKAEEKPAEEAKAEEKPAEEAKPAEQQAAASGGGNVQNGEKVFKKCKACHDAKADGKHKVGPNLFGIVGKAAGTADGFGKYSDGMKSSGMTWDAATLDAFLADPKGTVGGTKMSFAGLKKAEDRADVIEYLSTLK